MCPLFGLAACGTLVLTSTWHTAQPSPAQTQRPSPAAAQSDSVANPTLRRELVARMQRDQQARLRLIEWMREQEPGDPPKATGDDPPLGRNAESRPGEPRLAQAVDRKIRLAGGESGGNGRRSRSLAAGATR